MSLQSQALKNMAGAVTSKERLEGLEPIIQEFHTRGIIGQVHVHVYHRNYVIHACIAIIQ